MRIAYTADLHGDIEAYRAFLELAVMQSSQAAIVGGDLLPHAINRKTAVQVQRDFIEKSLRPMLELFQVRHPGIKLYLLPGNDDWAAAIATLEVLERDGLVCPLHERVYALCSSAIEHQSADAREVAGASVEGVSPGSLWLAGYACVPLTPFSIKDYERRDDGPLPPFSFGMSYISWSGTVVQVSADQITAQPSIAEGLEALAEQSDPVRTIYVCHTPPANTPLDQMMGPKHVGSRALRSFIERYEPPLTLHGHIHEAPRLSGHYVTQIGSTVCVNPGHDQRRLHAVTLDTDDIMGTIEHTVYGRPNLQR